MFRDTYRTLLPTAPADLGPLQDQLSKLRYLKGRAWLEEKTKVPSDSWQSHLLVFSWPYEMLLRWRHFPDMQMSRYQHLLMQKLGVLQKMPSIQ